MLQTQKIAAVMQDEGRKEKWAATSLLIVLKFKCYLSVKRCESSFLCYAICCYDQEWITKMCFFVEGCC